MIDKYFQTVYMIIQQLLPTFTPFLDASESAESTISLRLMLFLPLITALQVSTIFGLQSIILCSSDSAENPAKTT